MINNKGFSLVEVLIVIAMTAILGSVTVLSFSTLDTARAKKASAKIKGQLNLIRTTTMNKSGDTALKIYKDSKGVYYVQQGTATTPSVSDFTEATGVDPRELGGKMRLTYTDSLSGGETEIGTDGLVLKFKKDDGSLFNQDGSEATKGTFTITVYDKKNTKRGTVEIKKTTGNVQNNE